MNKELKNEVPKHVAIIMDGNGRWAKKRHLPRIAGHKKGMEIIKNITKAANRLGIKVLTVYAFSTENWQRSQEEVSYLMKLPIIFFNSFVPELIKENVRVNIMGYVNQLPNDTQKAISAAIQQTSRCDGMILNIALNYGGHDELVTAFKLMTTDLQKGKLTIDQIDQNLVSDYLMTHELKPYDNPELMIRTSGEQRISNFLLWQLAYSEFMFTDTYWPDFTAEEFYELIHAYQKRDRRFGKIKDE